MRITFARTGYYDYNLGPAKRQDIVYFHGSGYQTGVYSVTAPSTTVSPTTINDYQYQTPLYKIGRSCKPVHWNDGNMGDWTMHHPSMAHTSLLALKDEDCPAGTICISEDICISGECQPI